MKVSAYTEKAKAQGAAASNETCDATGAQTLAPRCPNCGWRDVRFARLRGALDWTLRKLSVAAFRCRSCGHRFYRYHRAA
jgi:DNA-directed RNA polymerase subunit M/transcription elongation factor TFIIS